MPGARHESGRFYAGLILAVLALLVAVEVYGFRNANLFAQEIWAPVGLARLLQFGALYIGAATALLILAPWIFAGLAAALLARVDRDRRRPDRLPVGSLLPPLRLVARRSDCGADPQVRGRRCRRPLL